MSGYERREYGNKHYERARSKTVFVELEKLIEKHKVGISGFGDGYEVENDILEFSVDGGYVEIMNLDELNKTTIKEIIKQI